MKLCPEVASQLHKVASGMFSAYAASLEGGDFGLYLPVCERDGQIGVMPSGHSQIENNLAVELVSSREADMHPDMEVVAWLGETPDRDLMCDHPGTGPRRCTHCTGGHDRPTQRCTGHPPRNNIAAREAALSAAPELDYQASVAGLEGKRELLRSLAGEGFGLALLHAHNGVYKFSKLPEGYVAVISQGRTEFRRCEEAAADPTFVPNIWRAADGGFQPAGGYSLQ